MTGKQFIGAILLFVWILSTAALSAFAFILGNYLPNSDYRFWVAALAFCNLIIPTKWFCENLKRQGD